MIGSSLPASLAVAGCILFGGCAPPWSWPAAEPPRLYELTPKSTFDDLPTVHGRLSVEVPTATAGLNSARIALRADPDHARVLRRGELDRRGPGDGPELFSWNPSTTPARSTSRAARWSGCAPISRCLTHVREFQAEYDGAGPAPGARPPAGPADPAAAADLDRGDLRGVRGRAQQHLAAGHRRCVRRGVRQGAEADRRMDRDRSCDRRERARQHASPLILPRHGWRAAHPGVAPDPAAAAMRQCRWIQQPARGSDRLALGSYGVTPPASPESWSRIAVRPSRKVGCLSRTPSSSLIRCVADPPVVQIEAARHRRQLGLFVRHLGRRRDAEQRAGEGDHVLGRRRLVVGDVVDGAGIGPRDRGAQDLDDVVDVDPAEHLARLDDAARRAGAHRVERVAPGPGP